VQEFSSKYPEKQIPKSDPYAKTGGAPEFHDNRMNFTKVPTVAGS